MPGPGAGRRRKGALPTGGTGAGGGAGCRGRRAAEGPRAAAAGVTEPADAFHVNDPRARGSRAGLPAPWATLRLAEKCSGGGPIAPPRFPAGIRPRPGRRSAGVPRKGTIRPWISGRRPPRAPGACGCPPASRGFGIDAPLPAAGAPPGRDRLPRASHPPGARAGPGRAVGRAGRPGGRGDLRARRAGHGCRMASGGGRHGGGRGDRGPRRGPAAPWPLW